MNSPFLEHALPFCVVMLYNVLSLCPTYNMTKTDELHLFDMTMLKAFLNCWKEGPSLKFANILYDIGRVLMAKGHRMMYNTDAEKLFSVRIHELPFYI